MSAFEKLLSQWADEQGFQTFAQDHSAVLRNLAKWLNRNSASTPSRLPYYDTANPNPAWPVHKDSTTAGES